MVLWSFRNGFRYTHLVCVVAFAFMGLSTGWTGAAEQVPGTKAGDETGITLESFDEVEKEEYDWGWIRWMMSSKINPQSELTFGVVEIKPHQRNPLHVHGNCEEILYVVSGSCEHRIGDRIDVLKAGDMIRIPAGAIHMARTRDEPMRAIIVYSAGQREFEVVEEK